MLGRAWLVVRRTGQLPSSWWRAGRGFSVVRFQDLRRARGIHPPQKGQVTCACPHNRAVAGSACCVQAPAANRWLEEGKVARSQVSGLGQSYHSSLAPMPAWLTCLLSTSDHQLIRARSYQPTHPTPIPSREVLPLRCFLHGTSATAPVGWLPSLGSLGSAHTSVPSRLQ